MYKIGFLLTLGHYFGAMMAIPRTEAKGEAVKMIMFFSQISCFSYISLCDNNTNLTLANQVSFNAFKILYTGESLNEN